jgi:uncharacterized protein
MGRWISPNTITGDAATGERYFRRNYINEEFWREIKKGNHILFVAPRRVGKTSIMKDLAENPELEYYCIYQNIQGVKSRNEFYERLFHLFLQCLNKIKKLNSLFKRFREQYSIEEISIEGGIKIGRKDIDYEKELKNIIPQLKDKSITTVIFLDEFAEVINTLNKRKLTEDAIDILHTLRELRSDSNFRHFKLVFAGSIGLQFVIKNMDRPTLINDLHPIETKALSPEEATLFILQLTEGATIQLGEVVQQYLQIKVKHLLPYYLQLMIEEIDLLARKTENEQISIAMVDEAFNKVLEKNQNFDDWIVRLKEYHPEHFAFINEILMLCAHKSKITIQEIYNIALREKYTRGDDYMSFITQLQNDGYLAELPKHTYRFLSPFLEQFWLNQYPVYNG